MTQQRVDTENPYFPFELESGKWFYHEDVVEHINLSFSKNPDKPIILVGGAGTGKTSTLKRIATEPHLLRNNSYAIYIDSKRYPPCALEELVPRFFNDIHEQIKKKGLSIKTETLAFSPKPTAKNIRNFLETLNPLQETNASFIIIVDEFENILENGDINTKSFFLNCFVEILKKPVPFKLILAVEKEWEPQNPEKKIQAFLKKSVRIKVDDFLADEVLAQLIRDPKGNRSLIEFSNASVQKIILLCGNNLYLQQLICYYIHELLLQKNKTSCEEPDVDAAVDNLLSEQRPDFKFAWKYKLNLSEKLVVSALADPLCTIKEGDYYHLIDNTLLDEILGTELFRIIENLNKENKLFKIKDRRFDRYPFQLPLFGMWINKVFPFRQTVESLIEEITHLSLSVAGKIMQFYPHVSTNEKGEQSPILQFSSHWYRLKNKVIEEKAAEQDFLEFAQLFCKICFGIDASLTQQDCGYLTFPIDNLKIGHFEKVAIFIQEKAYLDNEDCRHIQNKILSYGEQEFEALFFLICFEQTPHIAELRQKRFLRIIYLEEENLKQILSSVRPFIALKQEIIKQSSPTFLSPYQPEGAALTTFYGRINVQRKILANSNRNCAIVGVRRIGKTSLLQNIIGNLPQDIIPIFLDLSQCKQLQTFFDRVSVKLKEQLKIKIPLCSTLIQFQSIIQHLARQYEEKNIQLLFVFDEVDSIIKFDREHKFSLLESFRVLANEGYARFIIAGFAELFRAKRKLNSPLYNFGDIIQLGPLNKDAAMELVTEPMRSIGLEFKNPTDAKRIFRYTSRHPSLTQYFCQRLVRTVEKKRNKKYQRIIMKRDIETVFDDEYKKHIINDIYMLRREEIPAIQELIIVLLVKQFYVTPKFRFEEIRNLLQNAGIKIQDHELTENLQELEIRYILKEEKNVFFTFPLEVFPEILRDKYILEDYKKRLLNKLSEVNQ